MKAKPKTKDSRSSNPVRARITITSAPRAAPDGGQALTTALAEIERLELALQEARRLREAQEEALHIAQQHETTLELLARAWRRLTGGS